MRGQAQESGISSWNCQFGLCVVGSGVGLQSGVLVLAVAEGQVLARYILCGHAEVRRSRAESLRREQAVG